MTDIRRSPTADGTYSELTPDPADGIHYTKVLRDDGLTTGNTHPGVIAELIDTYKFSVPTGTTKITVHSKTKLTGALVVASVQNVMYDGAITRGTLHYLTTDWLEVEDEFTGTFSGEIEFGIALDVLTTTTTIFTTLVYIEFEDEHGSLIDMLVNDFGETVTLKRITNEVFDNYDEVDDTSTYTETDIKAVVWRPTERRVIKIVGREFDADQAITVDSTIDISPTRNGVPDRILVRGHWYDVWNIIQLTHPFTGTKRQAVLLKL